MFRQQSTHFANLRIIVQFAVLPANVGSEWSESLICSCFTNTCPQLQKKSPKRSGTCCMPHLTRVSTIYTNKVVDDDMRLSSGLALGRPFLMFRPMINLESFSTRVAADPALIQLSPV